MTDPNQAAGAATATHAAQAAAHNTPNGSPPESSWNPVEVTPADPRYASLAVRGVNSRYPVRPEAFQLVGTTAQVVDAVGAAVRSGRRIAVRSGGHCYENFVGDPAVQVVIDLAEMNAVSYDAARRAFMVEAGARLSDVYRTLYHGWGVTVPGGASASVAFGGHLVGGGYGPLSRRFGLSVDHLYAVEVVVVDDSGDARAVVATREPSDPNRELWWAHTGAGGGNFGVVTRYWLRSPSATGADPAQALPRPPGSVLASSVMWPREMMDKAAFRRLVANHGEWHERHSGPDSPYRGLFSGLVLFGRQPHDDQGLSAISFTHLDATGPDSGRLLEEHIAALSADVGVEPIVTPAENLPWLASVKALADAQDAETGRQKMKVSYLRRRFTDAQIDTLHDRLDQADHHNDSITVSIQSSGGRINTVAPDATAVPQRDSVMRALFLNAWQDPEHDEANTAWLQRLYRDVYAGTGGVPVPGEQADGCYINFPDIDMADPEWNTSGVPWHELYYKDNYARLQAVKAQWDPGNVFRHALSVRPAR